MGFRQLPLRHAGAASRRGNGLAFGVQGFAGLVTAIGCMAGSAWAQTPAAPVDDSGSVLLETVTVTHPRPAPPRRASTAAPRSGGVSPPATEANAPAAEAAMTPSFEAQQQRFARRPGAESVVSVKNRDAGLTTNLRDVLEATPGVFVTDRGENSLGTISIRGSDIAQTGPRSGRGVRAYIDGIPLGRIESGITLSLFDLSAADYLEVYRGANSLRYGALATGGALNLISKTGLSSPGARISGAAGSNGMWRGQLEYGGVKDRWDYYFQTNSYHNDGYEYHSSTETPRVSGNVGWRPNDNVESRTYFAAGATRQELPTSVPLNQIYTFRRSGYDPSGASFPYDLRANFDYQRVANKTVFRDGDTSFEIAPYFLHTALDHLPSPRAGIIGVDWYDYGLSMRVEHKTDIAGLPTELVAGYRPTYESANYRSYQWVAGSGGTVKGPQVQNDNLSSWLHEVYGEATIEVLPNVRTFLGLQAFTTSRNYRDNYAGPVIPSGGLLGPGSSNGRRNYDRDFEALNPKVGASWEYAPHHFVYGNVSRSTEVPNSGDIFALLSIEQAVNIKLIQNLEMQKAWTFEAGMRGGWDRFTYDVTLYHMNLRDEILSQCALGLIPAALQTPAVRGQFACNIVGSLVPFNADRTVHRGVEAAFRTKPFVDVFTNGDDVFFNTSYTYSDFYFDNDRLYGNSHLPVIPKHHAFFELGYHHPSGFYASGNVQYVSERASTFDGSGGSAFTIPSYTLLGARLGWRAPDGSSSLWFEARNLTDVAYAGDFTALRTAADAAATGLTVTPGTGRAFYLGFSKRLD